uniref:Uncharacterized protein n=1 Tax=Oryzias melastigma TaxID=30732 RepID=A0A3B3DIE3_ORYME
MRNKGTTNSHMEKIQTINIWHINNTIPTVKHEFGSLMVCGCVDYKGRKQTLPEDTGGKLSLFSSEGMHIRHTWTFQHENDQKHKTNYLKRAV